MDGVNDSPDAFDGAWQIPQYKGNKMTCATCEHHFKPGDPVMVSEKENLLFCPVPEDRVTKNCVTGWVFENGKAILVTTMWFYGKPS